MSSIAEETTLLLRNPDAPESPPRRKSAAYLIAVICSVIVLFDLAGYLQMTAQTAVFEGIVCRDYFGPVPEGSELCKAEPIQAEVALLNGLLETFQTIPGIITGIPYGVLADRVGYKKVMALSVFGSILADSWMKLVCWIHPILPLRAVWFGSLWGLIGGGPQTATAMCFAVVAQVTEPEERTRVFSLFTAVLLVSEFIATPAGAALTTLHPWVALLSSTGLLISSLCSLCLLFPDVPTPDASASRSEPVERDPSANPPKALHTLSELARWVWQNKNATLIIFSSFASTLARQSLSILMQYVSKKFHLSLSQASYFIPIRSGTTLLVLVCLLPMASQFLSNRSNLPSISRDKYLTQLSAMLLCLACVAIFLAPSTVFLALGLGLYGLGSSLPVTSRTLLTSLVDPEYLGTSYSMVGVVTSAGMILAGPGLAATFRQGMLWEGVWMGLPFLVAAGMYAIVLLAVLCVRIPRAAE